MKVSVLLLLLVSCNFRSNTSRSIPTPQPEIQNAHTLVLGEISDDPTEVIEGDQPLADYLATNLRRYGITDGEVRVVQSIEAMIELMANGEVDLYFDSIYPATLVSDATGGKMILRRWRFGVAEYHSVIFASKESGINDLEDLPGHMIAMDAPYSTSGFLLPAVYLSNAGLHLVGKDSISERVPVNEVGFVFSYDDQNTLQWVLSGLTPAGAVDNYNFDVAFPEDVTQKLTVLGRTESVPRQVVVAGPGLEGDLLSAIQKILLEIHTSEAGQAVLEPFQTTRFDEFPEGIENATKRMREMIELVKEIPIP